MATWDIGPRGNGKTLRLVEEAARRHAPIITQTAKMADFVRGLAREAVWLDMPPTVLSVHEVMGRCARPHDLSSTGFVLDDADRVLEGILGGRLHYATATGSVMPHSTDDYIILPRPKEKIFHYASGGLPKVESKPDGSVSVTMLYCCGVSKHAVGKWAESFDTRLLEEFAEVLSAKIAESKACANGVASDGTPDEGAR